MTSTQGRHRALVLVLWAAFTLVATSGCAQDAAPTPDPKAAVAKLKPGSTACNVFPTDLALKATSKFPGGLTQGGQPGTNPGSGFRCSIEVLKSGMRLRAIAVNLSIVDVDDTFSAIRQSLRQPPYLTLPARLGEGYATDDLAALLRRCPRPAERGDEDYIIGIEIEKDIGFIPRTDLAKVITDAVPVIDKHLGCLPAAKRVP